MSLSPTMARPYEPAAKVKHKVIYTQQEITRAKSVLDRLVYSATIKINPLKKISYER